VEKMKGLIKIAEVLGVIAAIATAILVSLPVVAQSNVDSATVTVDVATQTWVNVDPTLLSWAGIDPGSEGATQKIQIENIGSTNITKIWMNSTHPSSRPFATGTNSSYDAGNFIAVSKEGVGEFYFVDRWEWNETRTLIYLKDPSGNTPPSGPPTYWYGRIRNTSYEYFWFVAPGANGNCSDGTFYIGNTPHTETQTGSVDFSSCVAGLTTVPTGEGCRYGALTPSSDVNWGLADVVIGTSGEQYAIAVSKDCNYLRVYKWNQDAPGAGTLTYDSYFFDSSVDGYVLYPGNSTVADIKVFVPYGVAYGLAQQGVLTVIVSQ
jgi:hypothetical protein